MQFDAVTEPRKLPHALRTTNTDDLIAALKRMLGHVLAEFSRDSDDANPPHARPHLPKRTPLRRSIREPQADGSLLD
jgi:hypothetical protein